MSGDAFDFREDDETCGLTVREKPVVTRKRKRSILHASAHQENSSLAACDVDSAGELNSRFVSSRVGDSHSANVHVVVADDKEIVFVPSDAGEKSLLRSPTSQGQDPLPSPSRHFEEIVGLRNVEGEQKSASKCGGADNDQNGVKSPELTLKLSHMRNFDVSDHCVIDVDRNSSSNSERAWDRDSGHAAGELQMGSIQESASQSAECLSGNMNPGLCVQISSSNRPPLPHCRRRRSSVSNVLRMLVDEEGASPRPLGPAQPDHLKSQLSNGHKSANSLSKTKRNVSASSTLRYGLPDLQAVRRARLKSSPQESKSGSNSGRFSSAAIGRVSAHKSKCRRREFTQAINISEEVLIPALAKDRALVDQLQYILDGIFQSTASTNSPVDNKELSAGIPSMGKEYMSPSGRRMLQSSRNPKLEADNALLTESLIELAWLFLKFGSLDTANSPKNRQRTGMATQQIDLSATLEHGHSGSDSSMLRCMAGQRKLLGTIVSRLLSLRALSTTIAVLVGAIMLVLANSDATELLFGKAEIAALVDAFFQVLPNLKGNSQNRCVHSAAAGKMPNQNCNQEQIVADKSRPFEQRRRRGKLARVANAKNHRERVMDRIRVFLLRGSLAEPFLIERIADDAGSMAIVFGLTLSAVLEKSDNARSFMMESRRIHKVVAVLYEARCICDAERSGNGSAQSEEDSLRLPRTIASVSLRILEHATLHRSCQERVARESRIIATSLSIIKFFTSSLDGLWSEGGRNEVSYKKSESTPQDKCCNMRENVNSMNRPHFAAAFGIEEISASNALRLCINLTHDCDPGLTQFIANEGVRILLDLLASVAMWSQNVYDPEDSVSKIDGCVELYDVRVLGVALLASVVAQNKATCSRFRELPVQVCNHRLGALEFVLDLLRSTGKEGLLASIEKVRPGTKEYVTANPHNPGRAQQQGPSNDVGIYTSTLPQCKNQLGDSAGDHNGVNGISKVMEQRVMTGYLCLLMGALVKGSAENRAIVRSAMPGRSLTALADVLDEFLSFHHEVGIASSTVDRMYLSIIENLRENPTDDVPCVDMDLVAVRCIGSECL